MKPQRTVAVFMIRGTVGHLAWPTEDGSPITTTLCGITSGRIITVVGPDQEAMVAELPSCLKCARVRRRGMKIPADADIF